jgi:hypothetical protein
MEHFRVVVHAGTEGIAYVPISLPLAGNVQRSLPIDIIPPQLNLQRPGDEEFESIIGFVQEHNKVKGSGLRE